MVRSFRVVKATQGTANPMKKDERAAELLNAPTFNYPVSAGWNGNVQGSSKYHSPLATLGGFAASGDLPFPIHP